MVEESLIRATRKVRSMRNVLVPINKLPPEILTHICALAPHATSDLAHLCAQVCRYWRSTLLASPSLWNVIHTKDPLHVEVHLVRSGKVPLEVYFHKGSPVDRFCQKVVPHMDRFRSLHLCVCVDDCEQILDSLNGGCGMTLLHGFYFAKGSIWLRLSAPMMEKISSFAANITTLSLWNVNTHLSSLTFPRLLSFSLVIHHGFEGPHISDVVGFLRNSPMLKWLYLRSARYPHADADDAGTHIEPVVLQHLECAELGGGPPSPSPNFPPYIKVDLLPYLRVPPTSECSIYISPMNTTFPHGTNYLLTLIRAWELISSPRGGFGEESGFTCAVFSIMGDPSTLSSRFELQIGLLEGPSVQTNGPLSVPASSRSWPDWEVADEESGAADTGDIQPQLSQLGYYLDPLRWSPSPLAAFKGILLGGFGHTRNKRKYLQYLRECFRGFDQVCRLDIEETNLWMITHLLQPFEDELGGMAMLFPKLESLSFDRCTPAELPLPALFEVVKKRAALGNVLEEVLVDDEEVDLSELSDTEEIT